MINDTKDILILVITGSIALFTIFACWAIYYVIVMLRNVSKMTISIREKMEIVDKILKLVKEKLERGSNQMAMIADSAIKLVRFLMDKQGKKPAKKKKK